MYRIVLKLQRKVARTLFEAIPTHSSFLASISLVWFSGFDPFSEYFGEGCKLGQIGIISKKPKGQRQGQCTDIGQNPVVNGGANMKFNVWLPSVIVPLCVYRCTRRIVWQKQITRIFSDADVRRYFTPEYSGQRSGFGNFSSVFVHHSAEVCGQSGESDAHNAEGGLPFFSGFQPRLIAYLLLDPRPDYLSYGYQANKYEECNAEFHLAPPSAVKGASMTPKLRGAKGAGAAA